MADVFCPLYNGMCAGWSWIQRRLHEQGYAWPEGRGDWPVHLPYRHGVKASGKMIFLGSQVAMDSDGNQ
jgi:hypothetical protein